ncbi:uncharacterized protein LOC135085731 [Ostrinia nubilalis]|uniref:uncharacterized protein LOC135085731 n=1 Tax=Ostrinia nubilalis TaxID=29057 RepID=UPI00308261E7
MVFTRPPSVPYPNVWRRFTVQRGSSIIHLRVQDLTEDLFEASIQLLLKYFTKDEPPCKYIGIHNYPSAVSELEKLWRTTVKDNLSLVCVEDKEGASEVVGVNVLTVVCKGDKEEPFHTEDRVWAKLFGAVDLVSRSVDIFTHFGVDKYLTAYGLVLPPEWRGLKVGQQLLESRVPFCKSLGIKVTVTVFTAAASQAVAKKANFVDLYEITYEELGKKGFLFPGVEEDTKSSKLMALVID